MGIVDDEIPRRRDPDDTVLPMVMLRVEERLREDRHTFRSEIAAIAAKQEVAQAQASKEHAEVKAAVAALAHRVEPIPKLVETVERLEESSAYREGHNAGIGEVRTTLWKAFGALVAVISAATAVLAVLMSNH